MEFVVSQIKTNEWDLFVRSQTDIIFYDSLWNEVLEKGLGGQTVYMHLENEEGILCAMSGILLEYYGLRLLYCSIPYGGYLGESKYCHPFMARFVEESKRADIVYFSPFLQEHDGCLGEYSEVTTEIVTRIDLRGRALGEIESAFEPSVKQSINKGVRLGLEVVRCADRESFLVAYRLYLETMRRNRAIARYQERWFAALHEVLAGLGMASVYLVQHAGVPVSATVVVNSQRVCHLLHSGSSTEYLSLRANDFVVCAIIRDAISSGKDYVDFMYSDPTDSALIRWKEKFGGRSHGASKFRLVNNRLKYFLWHSAKRIYPLLRCPGRRAAAGQS